MTITANKYYTYNIAMDLKNITTYHAGIAQARAYRVLKQLMTTALKKHGLGMMQWAILGLVYEVGAKGIRITDLAARLDTTLAFVTTHINLLETKGMVKRSVDPSDSRARIVVLNKKHRSTIPAIEKQVRRDLRESVGANISTEELGAYVNVLNKIAGLSKNPK
ncbi:hypothetical protein BH23PAT1_BH23PAT1_2260 [soil metagenome]